MEHSEKLWKEYAHLKDEIRHLDSQNYQVLAFVGAAVFATIAAGSRETTFFPRIWIAASVYLVTFLGSQLIENNRRQVWRVSTYMRVFLEGVETFALWESRLHKREEQLGSEKAHDPNRSDPELLTSIFRVLLSADIVATVFILETTWRRLNDRPPLDWWEWLTIPAVLATATKIYWYDLTRERILGRNQTAEINALRDWKLVRDSEALNSQR